MRKAWVVFKREYLQTASKKSFLDPDDPAAVPHRRAHGRARACSSAGLGRASAWRARRHGAPGAGLRPKALRAAAELSAELGEPGDRREAERGRARRR